MVRNLTETVVPTSDQRLMDAVERLGRLPVLSATVRRVQVQVADRAAAVAGGAREEAVGGGLDGELGDRLAADERDRGTDAAGAQRARAGGGVGVAQQVGGQALIGLEGGDHVANAGILALGDRLDAAHRRAEHGEPAELFDGVGKALLCGEH